MALDFDFSAVEPNSRYFVALSAGIRLMDNHKWALLAWEQHRRERSGDRYSLMHADYQWDAIDQIDGDEQAQAQLVAADLRGLWDMTAHNDDIAYESFVAAAVRLGLFSEVHFSCLQTDGGSLDKSLFEKFNATQTVHTDVASLAAVVLAKPIIFDLCLDLFNRPGPDNMQYGGARWSDDEVLEFLNMVGHHVRAAKLVTITLSFEYSGPKDDTRHLAELVVPLILEWRH